MSLLTADRVSVAFGKKVILDEARFALQPGEKIGLVGPNGSGKTTLLRLVSGEREPDEGDIAFARGIRAGYLPQDILELPQGTLIDSVRASVGDKSHIPPLLLSLEQDLAGANEVEAEEIAHRILARNGLKTSDLDLFVSHQANRRIIESAAEKLGLGPDKMIINIDKYGNTTAATIPLALNDAVCSGRLKKGDLVLLASVGAGFTVGAVLLRWGF